MDLKEFVTPDNLEKLETIKVDETVLYSVKTFDRDRNKPRQKWVQWSTIEYELCDIIEDDRIDKDAIIEKVIRWLLVEDNQHLDVCVYHDENEQDYSYVRVHYGAIEWLRYYYFNYTDISLTKEEKKSIRDLGGMFIKKTSYFSTPPIGTAKELNQWFTLINSLKKDIRVHDGEYIISEFS